MLCLLITAILLLTNVLKIYVRVEHDKPGVNNLGLPCGLASQRKEGDERESRNEKILSGDRP